jgi:DUF4097 and DUF4098 domain-containing protein YvlB
MSQETIEKKFTVESPARLKIGNIRGSVDIQAGEKDIIEITAVKHLNTGSQDQTVIEIDQEDDGRVIVKTDYTNSITNWFGILKPCKVDYTVRIPEECEVRASGVSCPITVSNLNGKFEINTVSGNLTISQVTGNVKLGTVSGSIYAQELSGDVDANIVSGSIRLMQSKISAARLKTVSGSMVVETPLLAGPYTFKGVSGSVSLVVPESTGCVAETKSVSGGLRTSLPVTMDKRQGSHRKIEIQGGGPHVTHKSVSGSLRIVTSEGEEIKDHKPKEKTRPKPENQMDVLHKIELGEISVEEALKELNA